MKSIFKCIVIAALALGANSCLDLEPKDQLADTNLWSVPGDFESFANQFYGWTHDFRSLGVYDDKRSDLIVDKGAKNVYSNGTNTVPESDGNYTDGYKRILRTNILLKNANNYSNPDDIAQYVGEAHFFRAYVYFHLMKLYGDLIILEEPIDVNDPHMKASRDDRSEVTDFIIRDLQEAIRLLPSTSEVELGRIGHEGASALLSRVALFEGTWQKFRGNTERARQLLDISAKAAKVVMESGKFEIFAPAALGDSAQKYMFILEDAKSNPAGLTKSANKEYIFMRRHDETLSPIGTNITKGWLYNAVLVSHKFVSMYLCQDGLPIEKSPLFKGYDKMISEWINRDNRMRYNLCRPHDNFWDNVNSRVSWNGDATDLASAATKDFQPTWDTGYFTQKWATERHVTTNYESYDFPLIRYAEVLLNYAEAVYERDGQISDADLDLSLNLVRRRVNTQMPKLSNAFVATNGLDMRTEIRRERTVELFAEGFRAEDLRRWKTAEVEMPMDFLGIKWQGTEFQSKMKTSLNRNADGFLIYETGRKWAEKNYLYPLPTDQLQLNPNLGQNPGWAQ